MEQHLRIVAVIQLVFGVLGIGLAVMVFVFGTSAAILSGDKDAAFAAGSCATILAAVVGVLALPSLVAGWGLLKRREWARILTLVLSVLQLANFPVGTAIGAYSLWALLNPESRPLFT